MKQGSRISRTSHLDKAILEYLFLCHHILLPGTGERLVVPHEKLGIFLKDLIRYFADHGDGGGVVALLPSLLELGADGLQAEHLQAFLL